MPCCRVTLLGRRLPRHDAVHGASAVQAIEDGELADCLFLRPPRRQGPEGVVRPKTMAVFKSIRRLRLDFGLAPCTASCPPLSGTAFGIAGFLAFEDGTRPLTGSPSGDSASGVGRSHGSRDYDQQSEKRGREDHSHHIAFPARSIGPYSFASRLGHRQKARFANRQTRTNCPHRPARGSRTQIGMTPERDRRCIHLQSVAAQFEKLP
jgi:hypothetical protein